MSRTETPATPDRWVELDVEVAPADEERAVAALWMAGGAGSWTVRPGLVRGYFERASEPEDVERRFRAAWREATGAPWEEPLARREVAGEDWLAGWRAGVEPVEVTPTLWVVPPGAARDPDRPGTVVVIQPGQGFGTGSHATTRALLAWLELEPGERVLDVGCGSGVLGIAGLALGARLAVGLDPDPDALANADENRRRNRVERELRLVRGSVDAIAPRARFDRVLANLDRRTLAALTGPLVERCSPGGRIGVAGLLAAEAVGFREVLAGQPVEIVRERTENDPATGDAWWSAWLARADS